MNSDLSGYLSFPPPHQQIINTFTEAVQTVEINQAVGKPHSLWVNFAKFYEENNQLPEVSEIAWQ